MLGVKKRRRKLLVFLVLIFCFGVCFYIQVSHPIIKTYTAAEIQSITERVVNNAVTNVINRTLSYDSLIDIRYDTSGAISSFTANQYEINAITREIVKEAQHQMKTIGDDGLNINIGTLTGIPFLLGRGPSINFKLTPIGAVTSSFDSKFNSVGINMTKHTLYLYIDVDVSIVLPVKSHNIHTRNQVMLAESIIVGKVPEVYLNGGSIGESLNLVP